MKPPSLPRDISVGDFDRLHDDSSAWHAAIESIARGCGGTEPVVQVTEGTVLVALLGRRQVLKLYPPFLRDHFEFEYAALARLGGRLRLPTPVLLQTGEHQGWPWLLMTQLAASRSPSSGPACLRRRSARCCQNWVRWLPRCMRCRWARPLATHRAGPTSSPRSACSARAASSAPVCHRICCISWANFYRAIFRKART